MVKLETSVWYTGLYLMCLASWPLPPNASNVRRALNLAHYMFIIILMALTIMQLMFFVIKNQIDLRILTEVFSGQCVYFHAIVKVGMYRYHRNKMASLLKSVTFSIANGSAELLKYLHQYARVGNIIYGTYTMSVILLALGYVLLPSFKSERALPTFLWYPFDYENSTLLFSLAYAQQAIATLLCGCTVGVDVMFGMIVFHCCAQFKDLQQLLANLIENDTVECAKGSGNEIRKRIAVCVHYHCEILKSIKDVNDVHTYISLTLFCTAIIGVTSLGFQVMNVSKLSMDSLILLGLNACCVSLQLLLYYLPGDILTEEAMAVGEAAYKSNWELMRPKQRKSVLLIMVQSSRETKLDVGRITALLLVNYTTFLTTTASYFTSLQAIAGTT